MPPCQQYSYQCTAPSFCEDLPSGGFVCRTNLTTSPNTTLSTIVFSTTTDNDEFFNTVLIALLVMICAAIVVALVITALLVILYCIVVHSKAVIEDKSESLSTSTKSEGSITDQRLVSGSPVYQTFDTPSIRIYKSSEYKEFSV